LKGLRLNFSWGLGLAWCSSGFLVSGLTLKNLSSWSWLNSENFTLQRGFNTNRLNYINNSSSNRGCGYCG
jgi:hypothetical protein